MNGSTFRAKLSDKEWDAMGHEAGDKVNVAAEPVELRDR
jgi:hypothetical protein